MKERNSLKEQVAHILRNSEKARNSDTYGITQLWMTFYKDHLFMSPQGIAVLLSTMQELPREDAFKRYRASFNAQGLYLPTDPEVIKARKLKEKDWRQSLSAGSVSQSDFNQ